MSPPTGGSISLHGEPVSRTRLMEAPLMLQDRLQLRLEGREVVLHHVPHDVEVHLEIVVDEDVAHPLDLGPGDRRVRRTAGGGQLVRRFAEDLQVVATKVCINSSASKAARPRAA